MSSTDDRHGGEQTDTRLAAECAKNHQAITHANWGDYCTCPASSAITGRPSASCPVNHKEMSR